MNAQELCELGKNVIELEAKMIQALIPRINDEFAEACYLLHHCKGRIIVMGMGKSGHIARKIAATLASTGTPAFFLHPGEAKHGDIGMMMINDIVIAISYSGESEEIAALLPVIERMQLNLISMTGKPHSTIARQAKVHLDVSVEKEACPLGLAPTASTTAALVMGDALAMALTHMRGFTHNDFALSHPGGALGRRLLLRVNSLMHKESAIPKLTPSSSLKEALIEMTEKKLGMTTVVNENGELVGIFTDGDLRRTLTLHPDIHVTTVHTVMSPNPKTITADTLAIHALEFMEKHKITALVVTDQAKKPQGIIHIHDILRAGIQT